MQTSISSDSFAFQQANLHSPESAFQLTGVDGTKSETSCPPSRLPGKQSQLSTSMRQSADLRPLHHSTPTLATLDIESLYNEAKHHELHHQILSTPGLIRQLMDGLSAQPGQLGQLGQLKDRSSIATILVRLSENLGIQHELMNIPGLIDGLSETLKVSGNSYANECVVKVLANLAQHPDNQAPLMNNPKAVDALVYGINHFSHYRQANGAEAAAQAFATLAANENLHTVFNDVNNKDNLKGLLEHHYNTSSSKTIKRAMKTVLNHLGIQVKPMVTLYRGVRHPKTATKLCQLIDQLPEKASTYGTTIKPVESSPKVVTPEQFKTMAKGRGCFRNQALHTFAGFTTRLTAYTSWTTDKSVAERFASDMRNTRQPERSILIEITLPADDPRIAPRKCGGAIMQLINNCFTEDEVYIDTTINEDHLDDIEVKCTVSGQRDRIDTQWAGWSR